MFISPEILYFLLIKGAMWLIHRCIPHNTYIIEEWHSTWSTSLSDWLTISIYKIHVYMYQYKYMNIRQGRWKEITLNSLSALKLSININSFWMDLKLSEENNSKLEKKGFFVERFLNIEKCRATRTKMIYHN